MRYDGGMFFIVSVNTYLDVNLDFIIEEFRWLLLLLLLIEEVEVVEVIGGLWERTGGS